MRVLSLSNWLSLFDNGKSFISYNQFMKKARVKSTYVYSLMNLVDEGKLSLDQSKMLYYKIIKDKDKYLTNFYYNNLEIRDDYIDERDLVINNNKYPKDKNIVRNLYYKDILLKTGTNQKNIRPFLEVIIDLFKYYIIDYKLVTPSILKHIENNKWGSMLSGLYFRASIMNPFLVYSLSCMRLDNPRRVLTPTLGWSSYLLGFMDNSNLEEYVGIDVIPKVCETSYKLCKDIRPDVDINIYCSPSEDVYRDKYFLRRYKNYFDVVYFSPPYYELELYEGKNQSTNRYATYDEWLDNYWLYTVRLCHRCLKDKGMLCYIISGYKSGGSYLDLDKDMNKIVLDTGFKYKGSEAMSKVNVGFTNHRKQSETIYYFQK